MASRLSLGTRVRCQSLRLRRPLWASEIDSLRGQAGWPIMQAKHRRVLLSHLTKYYLFESIKQIDIDIL